MRTPGSAQDNQNPATLQDVMSLIEASTVAQGIAICAALHSIDPKHVESFARNLAELAPQVGASDEVAQHFLECVEEGVDGFLRNRG